MNDHSVASDPNWIRIELNGFVTWETRFVCGQPGKRVNVTTGVNMTNFRSKQTTNHYMTERNYLNFKYFEKITRYDTNTISQFRCFERIFIGVNRYSLIHGTCDLFLLSCSKKMKKNHLAIKTGRMFCI